MCASRLPRLIGRSDNASHTSSAHTIYGSLAPSSGSKGSKHNIRVLSKAERKALGLAVTRVSCCLFFLPSTYDI